MKHSLRVSLFGSVSLGALVLFSPGSTAFAADTPVKGEIETVVVTAERRAQNEQDVPASVVALSGDVIRKQRIVDFNDVANRTPGLSFSGITRNQAHLAIRGSVSGNSAPGTTDATQIFTDEVAGSGSIADTSADLYDISRVEVLKGPQGTFFGKNVLGGAIAVYTNKPTFDTDIGGELTAGSDSLFSLKGYVNAPLIADKLAFRLSLTATTQDGLYNNVFLNNKVGNTHNYGARAQLLIEPTSDLEIRLMVDSRFERGDGGVAQLFGNVQPNAFGVPLPTLSYGANDSNQVTNGSADRDLHLLTARADWQNPLGTLTFLSGLRLVNSQNPTTQSADPTGVITNNFIENDSIFSEELRLTSPSDQPLRYIVGAYRSDGHKEFNANVTINPLLNTSAYAARLSAPAIAAAAYGFAGPENAIQNVSPESTAIFGEINYDVIPSFTVTVGGRYTWDEMSGSAYHQRATVLYGAPISANFSGSWNAFTPKVSLEWHPIDDVMLYALYSRGYQSGGFDVSGAVGPSLAAPLLPEYANNFEVGGKSEWFDHRLLVNATLFRINYTNLQIRNFVGVNFISGNAAKGQDEGVEAQIIGQVTDWLQLGASYTYQDSIAHGCLSFGGAACGTAGTSSIEGFVLPLVSKHTLNLFADANWQLPGGDGLSFSADWTYRSPQAQSIANPTTFNVNSFSNGEVFYHYTTVNRLINLRLAYSLEDTGWEFSAWGKNVLNDRAMTNRSNLTTFLLGSAAASAGGNVDYVTRLDPAIFGATVTYKLGG